MDLICPLPNAPHTLIECENQRLVLAFADGLAELKGAELDFVARDPSNLRPRGDSSRARKDFSLPSALPIV